jgi:nucleoside-diphosphate-sugar epimerase
MDSNTLSDATTSSDRFLSRQYAGARALVLGGTGFLGGAIARRLIDLKAQVTLTTTHLISAKQLTELRDRAHVKRVDVRDRARLVELIRDQDFLFNFAGLSGAVASNQQPLADLDVNGGGVLTVVDVCRELNPQVRIIFPGTRLQYGVPQYLPVDEQHPMRPVSIYGVHKLLGEMYHLLYHRNYGLRATVLRISNPYGFSLHQPESDGYNIASRFIRAALEDRPLRVFGTGQQLRDYIHIDDVVEAVLRTAGCAETIGQAYNLGLGSPVRLIDLAQAIVQLVGRGRIEQVDWPPNFSLVETGDFSCNIDKLVHALQWRPQIQMPEGIRRSLFGST